MNTPTFRPCTRDDLQAFDRLVKQLYIADLGEVPANPDAALTFSEFERHPQKGKIVIFELDGEPIGYAILVYFWSNEFCGDIVEIDELLVDEKHRGKGVARAFFSWLDLSCQDCAGYALQTSEHNEGARRLYRSIGFELSRSQYLVKIHTLSAARDGAVRSSSP